MISQVDRLAQWAAEQRPTPETPTSPARPPAVTTQTLAIASGKGGVGKTTIAVNLAWLLAKRGLRVLYVDADFGCANAQCYWPDTPTFHLGDVFAGRCTVADVIATADDRVPTLRWIPGAPSAPEWANVSPEHLATLETDIVRISAEYDWILWDLGAGVQGDLVHLAAAADGVLIVTQAEQPAIYDAYGFMKALHAQQYTGQGWICCNRAPSLELGRLTLDQLAQVAHEHLQATWKPLGVIRHDPWVTRALQQHRMVAATDTVVTRDLIACRQTLLGAPATEAPRGIRGLWASLIRSR